jgi:serine/threonine protein kinase
MSKDIIIGTQLGPYTIGDRLGHGMFGTAYHATIHTKESKQVNDSSSSDDHRGLIGVELIALDNGDSKISWPNEVVLKRVVSWCTHAAVRKTVDTELAVYRYLSNLYRKRQPTSMSPSSLSSTASKFRQSQYHSQHNYLLQCYATVTDTLPRPSLEDTKTQLASDHPTAIALDTSGRRLLAASSGETPVKEDPPLLVLERGHCDLYQWIDSRHVSDVPSSTTPTSSATTTTSSSASSSVSSPIKWLTQRELIGVCRQLAVATAAMHTAGMSHRDITCRNIFCKMPSLSAASTNGNGTAEGMELRLGDFGSSVITNDLRDHLDGHDIGGWQQYTQHLDILALGITFIELMTLTHQTARVGGRPPSGSWPLQCIRNALTMSISSTSSQWMSSVIDAKEIARWRHSYPQVLPILSSMLADMLPEKSMLAKSSSPSSSSMIESGHAITAMDVMNQLFNIHDDNPTISHEYAIAYPTQRFISPAAALSTKKQKDPHTPIIRWSVIIGFIAIFVALLMLIFNRL